MSDRSPAAFEHVVDQLLESPHFGERWARHWMDLVRYAETYGHEFDYPIPHPTEYRDYLIRAFNADVPYNQFVKEHLAGDLLDEPRRHPTEDFNESVIGTGFWYFGEATHAPVDVTGDEAGRIDNQIDVLTKSFLGLTVACARCHDHKFDAISTKDYYSLAGLVKSSRRQEAFLDPGRKIEQTRQQLLDLRRIGDGKLRAIVAHASDGPASGDFARYLVASQDVIHRGRSVAEVASEQKLDEMLLAQWVTALAADETRKPGHAMRLWVELARHGDRLSTDQIRAFRDRLRQEKESVQEQSEQQVVIADFRRGSLSGWSRTGHAFDEHPITAGTWDASGNGPKAVPSGLVHSGLTSNRLQGVLRSPTFVLTKKNIYYHMAGQNAKVRLIIDGYFMDVYNGLLFGGCNFKVDSKDAFEWRRQAGDVSRYVGHRAHIEIIDDGDGFAALDKVVLSDGNVPKDPPSLLAEEMLDSGANEIDSLTALADVYQKQWQVAASRWSKGNANTAESDFVAWVLNHGLIPVGTESQAFQDLHQQRHELAAKLPRPQRVLAMADGNGWDSKVSIRGNHRTLGEKVERGRLTALAATPKSASGGSRRLEFAEQVVASDNPLTSRVMVNRIWHHLFGRGIVSSTDNFGVLGERPTHPELLDYLAVEFVADDWSIKRLIRRLVLSSTYQMSSVPVADAVRKDPKNDLLHRMRIRRLQGEAIRDAILTVSGRLDRRILSGSVPVHLTEFMQGRGRPRGSGPLDGDGRRSLYIGVRRNFLSPMMLAFDTPIPFSTVGRRNVSNVPAQALMLMNDPFVVQQAQQTAARLLEASTEKVDSRVVKLYVSAFGREPSAEEVRESVDFLERQGRALGLEPAAAVHDRRTWTDLCHVIFNVKEFTFIH